MSASKTLALALLSALTLSPVATASADTSTLTEHGGENAAIPAASGRTSSYGGWLSQGRSTSLDLTLYGGFEYTYTGACDEDCSDLDFYLYRWNGSRWVEVDRDTAPDDYPVVGAVPRRAGTYRLVTYMASCSLSPCEYEVTVS